MIPVPSMPRRRVGLACLLVVALVGIALGVVHLTGKPDRPEGTFDAVRAEAARERFASTVAPSKDVSSTLLAPATQEWWNALTGFAAPLDLSGTAMPDRVSWLGYSSALTRSGARDGAPSYPALYLGFATDDEADDFRLDPDCTCKLLVRENVATVMFVTADPQREPFPTLEEGVDPADLVVDGASWNINVSALARHLSDSTPYPQQQQQQAIFAALGVDANTDGSADDVTWQATSIRPEGPWTGKLDGFAADAVSTYDLAAAVADTVVDECDDAGECETTDLGLMGLLQFMFVEDDEYEWGTRELGDPSQVDKPMDGYVLRGGIAPANWEPTFLGLDLINDSALEKVWFDVSDTSELTLRFTFRDPSSAPEPVVE